MVIVGTNYVESFTKLVNHINYEEIILTFSQLRTYYCVPLTIK